VTIIYNALELRRCEVRNDFVNFVLVVHGGNADRARLIVYTVLQLLVVPLWWYGSLFVLIKHTVLCPFP